jgi:hypothetical protein
MSRYPSSLFGAALVSIVAAGALVSCTTEDKPVVPTSAATNSLLSSLFEDTQQPSDQLPEGATATTVEQLVADSTRLLTTVGDQTFFAARPAGDSESVCLVIVEGVEATSGCGGEPVGIELQGGPKYSLSSGQPSFGSSWTEISTYLWQSEEALQMIRTAR